MPSWGGIGLDGRGNVSEPQQIQLVIHIYSTALLNCTYNICQLKTLSMVFGMNISVLLVQTLPYPP